jgi:hypothetical protein
MFRFFNFFGQSATLNALDDALRASGVHPILMPEPVKLTVTRLLKQDVGPARSLEAACADAAQLLAYCMLGSEAYAESNGVSAAVGAEQRLEDAIAAGDSLDAKLILLVLHAGLIAPEVADRVEADED